MTKWISVNDKMPEEGTYVLTCDYKNKESVLTARYKEGQFYIFSFIVDIVTHWMPLPEVPNENNLR
ncbi:MAG: DUF551 domain-containing protein [Proteobacteria bacterium]|jgi:hypothetical protein|nr:DUF551 domain-containing protein [Pseudomonadota bacterium]